MYNQSYTLVVCFCRGHANSHPYCTWRKKNIMRRTLWCSNAAKDRPRKTGRPIISRFHRYFLHEMDYDGARRAKLPQPQRWGRSSRRQRRRDGESAISRRHFRCGTNLTKTNLAIRPDGHTAGWIQSTGRVSPGLSTGASLSNGAVSRFSALREYNHIYTILVTTRSRHSLTITIDPFRIVEIHFH